VGIHQVFLQDLALELGLAFKERLQFERGIQEGEGKKP
jgi:hypothetical protein